MKITIEITGSDLVLLLDHLAPAAVPGIMDELHEDFNEDPDSPEPDPEPEQETHDSEPKPSKYKRKCKRKQCLRPVEVLDGKIWHRFPSVKDAALFIGCSSSQVSTSIANGYKCKGHEVRYGREEQDEEVLP